MTAIGLAHGPNSVEYWRGRAFRAERELGLATEQIDALEAERRDAYRAHLNELAGKYAVEHEALRADLLDCVRWRAERQNQDAYAAHTPEGRSQADRLRQREATGDAGPEHADG